jgi:hypothetical protein
MQPGAVMGFLYIILGLALIVVAVFDAFEAVVMPRTVTERLGLNRLVYLGFSWLRRSLVRRMSPGGLREFLLRAHGPFALVFLIALWTGILIFGFALVQFGLRDPLVGEGGPARGFGDYVYMSGVTFFTLGYGDLSPVTGAGRLVSVVQSGTGFALLALTIGYLPAIYAEYTRRERGVTIFDARSGRTRTGGGLLLHHVRRGSLSHLGVLLEEWEIWGAELLETYISYPTLIFYRSQHDERSWLGAVVSLLDSCALLLAGIRQGERDRELEFKAQACFDVLRLLLVETSRILSLEPAQNLHPRLDRNAFARLCSDLEAAGLQIGSPDDAYEILQELRLLYEPHAAALADDLVLQIPSFECAPQQIERGGVRVY